MPVSTPGCKFNPLCNGRIKPCVGPCVKAERKAPPHSPTKERPSDDGTHNRS